MSKLDMIPTPPPPEVMMKIVLPLLGPNGPFTIGMCTRGRYFAKAPRTMNDFYVSSFSQYSQLPFIVYNKERYTFGKSWEISKQLGCILSNEFGIKTGDRVAIAMRNYPEWCLSMIGCGTIGAIPVPLNSFWKGKEMCYGLSDSGSKIIFCDMQRYKDLEPFLGEINTKVIVVRAPPSAKLASGVYRYEELNFNQSIPSDNDIVQFSAREINPEDPAMIVYTSGTTGHPKGVVLTHSGVQSQMEMAKFLTHVQEKTAELPGMPPLPDVIQHSILCVVPLFHVTGCHHNFLQSIALGRKFVLMYKWDAELALQLIQQERITSWTGVPTMAMDIMEHPSFHKYDTSSLLSVGSGGAPTPAHQVKRTAESFKNGLATSAYGLTETNGAICINFPLSYIRKPTSCGSAFPIVEVKIVDVDTGNDVAPGERGELLLRSGLNMKEYWNKPEATKKAITSDGYFRTGDIATLDKEGFIYIVDRAKDIIIRGGENISCSEVENAIYTHDSVRECAVFGLPDERLGEIVGVLIMLKDSKSASASEIHQHLKGKIASFKIPDENNIFFTKQALPRGATGKIMKRDIKSAIMKKMMPTSKL